MVRRKMKVIKLCYPSTVPETTLARLVKYAYENSVRVDVQTICNTPYLRWLTSSKIMPWDTIVDVFLPDDNELIVFKQDLFKYAIGNADVYLVEQITYGTPVDGAELITSCYLWNYETAPSIRNDTMYEHFLMEQQQEYYDYVAFQLVQEVLTTESPAFDFFFESHVSHPDGINEIYSKPALEGMREHSKIFLNTNTRLLSFGSVDVRESRNGI